MLSSYRFFILHDPIHVYVDNAVDFVWTLIPELAEGNKDLRIWELEPKIDSVRKIITESEVSSGTTLFILRHAEKMGVNALNAMLKVTEEVPDNFFILLVTTNLEVIPDTLISRAKVLHAPTSDSGFHPFVEKVYHNIHKVTSENAFKIVDKLDCSANPTGLTPREFLRQYVMYCEEQIRDNSYYDPSVSPIIEQRLAGESMRQLQYPNANKRGIMIAWIIDVRWYGQVLNQHREGE